MKTAKKSKKQFRVVPGRRAGAIFMVPPPEVREMLDRYIARHKIRPTGPAVAMVALREFLVRELEDRP